VHRVLAVDGDDLVGILSAFDLVKLVAERAV
jgi:CBS domain-containing protein